MKLLFGIMSTWDRKYSIFFSGILAVSFRERMQFMRDSKSLSHWPIVDMRRVSHRRRLNTGHWKQNQHVERELEPKYPNAGPTFLTSGNHYR